MRSSFAIDRARVLLSVRTLSFGEAKLGLEEAVEQGDVSSNGHHLVAAGKLVVSFSGSGGVHKTKITRSRGTNGNGISVRLELRGWASITQLLLGFMHEGEFRKLSVPHLRQNRSTEVSVGLYDLIFGIQNRWPVVGTGPITDVHVHVQGTPGPKGASLQLDEVMLWEEAPHDFWIGASAESPRRYAQRMEWPRRADPWAPLGQELFDAIDPYLRRFFPDLQLQADRFMNHGEAPSHRASLPWRHDVSLPESVPSNNAYRWSWHGLHSVFVLTTSARWTGNVSHVFAARSLAEAWLERSFYQVEQDAKFCWYDHGTADRIYAFVFLWDYALRLGFDARFHARLLEALSSHLQLLASEAFYSGHQKTRYHNHAVFQDLALMFGSLALPELLGARTYLSVATERLADQLQHVLVEEHDCAILLENSVSYHVGFQGMIEFADRMMRLSNVSSSIPKLAEQMARFTELASYPDGRLPGHGDSPRTANPKAVLRVDIPSGQTPQLTILTKVGHAFARGNHQDIPFMLSLFATSLEETHKHEDNLSFTLYFDGIEWLIDPSFYCYEPTSAIASYLRTAPAHNALVLPDLAYSIQPGIAQLDGVRDGERFVLRGHHSAYGALGVQREVEGRFDELALRFEDQVVANEAVLPSRAWLMLHCGDEVTASVDGTVLTLRHPASAFELTVRLPNGSARVLRDHDGEGKVRGVTGLGFMEYAPIDTVECTIDPAAICRWQVTAQMSGAGAGGGART